MIDKFMEEAIKQAQKSAQEGGIPIGAVLVLDEQIIGRGHNQRIQKGSPTLHAEIDCLENAGRLSPEEYKRSKLYTTLSPCHMCSGAVLLYKIPEVIIGENISFLGAEELLKKNGVKLYVFNDERCVKIMKDYIEDNPKLWKEDIGEK
ncbi:cytosine deaminase [Zhouia amylolytica]|uniref:CMP/dCMP deaminase zinc-binding protein n=2 Tax=Zhouia amylolytica TaxID=376730 RepID=W2UU33_9FLAO|nr:nucleoside deaminase [Zhouia amylolytica]ETN97041.1 CMP/dCMP deaminase zinc-binding protein [Zhouia amylolytica AD3]MCQ0110117.1 nucleoside deaminase [Zhouia amylolytica]SFT07069.1 cytosine deaminase [Zhouia amylolytica]